MSLPLRESRDTLGRVKPSVKYGDSISLPNAGYCIYSLSSVA